MDRVAGSGAAQHLGRLAGNPLGVGYAMRFGEGFCQVAELACHVDYVGVVGWVGAAGPLDRTGRGGAGIVEVSVLGLDGGQDGVAAGEVEACRACPLEYRYRFLGTGEGFGDPVGVPELVAAFGEDAAQ